ncbi:thioredoxin domain-containing protein, DsbA family [Skeletonema marinoi]|uniref:Thioredoxin domain-containing protein, DsbA family n=1 Tax=Skeletonema marinoi TaxID=267567 RepID=A0AAD9D9L0_9STRA|nr:thioredoxin domain-containing protein, DsbA family [Skeletonema marinoi]
MMPLAKAAAALLLFNKPTNTLAMSTSKKISVTCYVGQKKLNAAIESFASQSSASPSSPPLSIEWKPYIIDPNTKTDGEEFEAYNIRRWGSSGWTHGLKRSGSKVGANFSNWKTWPNTLRAHQLIAYVTSTKRKVENKPTTSECNAAIFDAMYERGENVSLVNTLVKIGTERLGVSTSEVDDLKLHLENNVGAKDVMKEIQTGRRRYQIQGVPFFVIGAVDGETSLGQPYGFSGAQDSGTFVDIFEELAGNLA